MLFLYLLIGYVIGYVVVWSWRVDWLVGYRNVCNYVLLLMISSSRYVSHMFVTTVLSSLVFRVVLL